VPKNSQLGMQIVQKRLRKTIYGLCRSCRGLGDLQLCYSPFGPLLLKILEQNTVEQGQVEFFKTAVPRVRAHARRRARGHTSLRHRPTEHNRRSTAATAGPTAPHRLPHPNPRRHASHLLRPSKLTSSPPNQWPHRRTSLTLPRTSSYAHRVAPKLPLVVAPRTALAPYRDPLPKARASIKGVELAAAHIAPGTEPPSRHCRRQWCPL
jgi:hypothetical protein